MIDTNTLELLQKVDSFYNTSWQHLIYLTSALLAVGLILVPFLVQWAQYKLFKSEEDSLKAKLTEHIKAQGQLTHDSLETSLKASLEVSLDKFSKEVAEVKNLVEKTDAMAKAAALHVQGMTYSTQNRYALAVESSALAVKYYLKSDDQVNLLVATRNIYHSFLSKLTTDLIQSAKPVTDIDKVIEQLATLLQEHNDAGRYTREISDIQLALREAHKRTSVSSSGSTLHS